MKNYRPNVSSRTNDNNDKKSGAADQLHDADKDFLGGYSDTRGRRRDARDLTLLAIRQEKVRIARTVTSPPRA